MIIFCYGALFRIEQHAGAYRFIYCSVLDVSIKPSPRQKVIVFISLNCCFIYGGQAPDLPSLFLLICFLLAFVTFDISHF